MSRLDILWTRRLAELMLAVSLVVIRRVKT